MNFNELSKKVIESNPNLVLEKSSMDWNYQGIQRVDKVPTVNTLQDLIQSLIGGRVGNIGNLKGDSNHNFKIEPLAKDLGFVYDKLTSAKVSFESALDEPFINEHPDRINAIQNALRHLINIEKLLTKIAEEMTNLTITPKTPDNDEDSAKLIANLARVNPEPIISQVR